MPYCSIARATSLGGTFPSAARSPRAASATQCRSTSKNARNFVRAADGSLRVIDLVAGPWPAGDALREPLVASWLSRVRADPAAPALPMAPDAEL